MENPKQVTEKKHRDKKQLIALNDEQETELLKVAYSTNFKHGLMIELALNTSLRVNELVNLIISDLYLKGETPYIRIHDRPASTVKEYNYASFKCKTDLSNRENPLDKIIAKKMRDYLKGRTIGYVFESQRGSDGFKHFNRNSVINMINKYAKKCKNINTVNHCIGFHTTRRTYASKLLDDNVPINQISFVLGHADISTTLRYLKQIRKINMKLIRSVLQKANEQKEKNWTIKQWGIEIEKR